jgi:hypothetical protein
MFGYIEKKFAKRQFFWVKGQDGLSYFSHFTRDVDAPRGHFCVFEDGVNVEFEPATNKKGVRPLACNLRLAETYESTDEKEVSTVYAWRGAYGFARRDCGCEVFVGRRDIITEGAIKVGTEIYHSVARSKKANGDTCWLAKEIEICIPTDYPLDPHRVTT